MKKVLKGLLQESMINSMKMVLINVLVVEQSYFLHHQSMILDVVGQHFMKLYLKKLKSLRTIALG